MPAPTKCHSKLLLSLFVITMHSVHSKLYGRTCSEYGRISMADQMHQHSSAKHFRVCVCMCSQSEECIWLIRCATDVHDFAAVALFATISWSSTSSMHCAHCPSPCIVCIYRKSFNAGMSINLHLNLA